MIPTNLVACLRFRYMICSYALYNSAEKVNHEPLSASTIPVIGVDLSAMQLGFGRLEKRGASAPRSHSAGPTTGS